MFSGVIIGLLVALSAAAWVYSKVMRQTGNNSQQSAIMAGLAAVVSFVVIVTLVAAVNQMTGN